MADTHDGVLGPSPDPASKPRATESGQGAVRHLTFPDGPRLELETLLAALSDQAQHVLATQGRLRALLKATAAFGEDLDLQDVLRHIVEAARELVQARFAALGVVQDGALVEFVHAGMDEATVAQIGDLPKGIGLLGHLISQPQPLTLRALSEHASSVGFPQHHPPMETFLGVPIRVHDEVFGHLYLTDSLNGEFSADDEQLVIALAQSAAAAIANARTYAQEKEHRRWLAASTVLTQELFAGDEAATDLVVRHALRGADADLAVIAAPGPDGVLRVQSATGVLADEFHGLSLEEGSSVAGAVFTSGVPQLIEGYRGALAGVDTSMLGAVVAVPLQARGHTIGTLSVARLRERQAFAQADMDQLAMFGAHAGLAMELDEGRRQDELLATLLDRQRIAEELQQGIIHDLFEATMALQSLSGRLSHASEIRAEILRTVESLDRTMAQVRRAAFDLRPGPTQPPERGT